ncbi:hypothetical protein ACFLSS_00695 [Bacteroidota bacterium]
MKTDIKKNKSVYLMAVGVTVFIIFSTISIFQGKAKIDEYHNHFPVLEGMCENGFFNYIFGEDYKAANTPLPYLAPYLIAKALSIKPNIYIARIVNFIISFLTVVLFILVLKRISGKPDLSLLIFLFYPYFIKTSFVFYLAIYGVFFLLLSIYILAKESKWRILGAGFSSTAGILSQQFIIAFIPSYSLSILMSNFSKKNYSRLAKHILFFVPVIIPIVLFILWGGLTNPTWRFHGPVLDLTHVTASFVILGGVFLPFAVDKINTLRFIPAAIFFSISLILVLLFSPNHSDYGRQGHVTGYTYNFISQLSALSYLFSVLFQVILCFSGLYIFYKLAGDLSSSIDRLIFISSLLFIIVFFFNTVYSERHLLPMVTLLFLLTIPRIQNRWLLNFWIGFQVIFGLCYYYYLLFVIQDFG